MQLRLFTSLAVVVGATVICPLSDAFNIQAIGEVAAIPNLSLAELQSSAENWDQPDYMTATHWKDILIPATMMMLAQTKNLSHDQEPELNSTWAEILASKKQQSKLYQYKRETVRDILDTIVRRPSNEQIPQ